MTVLANYRVFDLPWTPSEDEERRFRRVIGAALGLFIGFGIVIPLLPERPRTETVAPPIPDRVVEFLLERPKPKPVPKVEQPPLPPPVPRAQPARRVVLAHDDDAAWRARVGRMLTEAGYAVLSAPDGFMALERCIDEAPSAVIAGLTMATLDGAQLAALLRTRFGDDAPPVLLVAGGPLPEPPSGVAAMIRSDTLEEDLLPELAAWIGTG